MAFIRPGIRATSMLSTEQRERLPRNPFLSRASAPVPSSGDVAAVSSPAAPPGPLPTPSKEDDGFGFLDGLKVVLFGTGIGAPLAIAIDYVQKQKAAQGQQMQAGAGVRRLAQHVLDGDPIHTAMARMMRDPEFSSIVVEDPDMLEVVYKALQTPSGSEPASFSKELMAAGIDPAGEQGRAMLANKYAPPAAAQTNVTVGGGPQIGTIPQGFKLMSDKTGAMWMEPIPGGPAAIEQAAAGEKKALQTEQRSAMVRSGHEYD